LTIDLNTVIILCHIVVDMQVSLLMLIEIVCLHFSDLQAAELEDEITVSLKHNNKLIFFFYSYNHAVCVINKHF